MSNIKRALISVFYKDGLLDIAQLLSKQGVEILSTGGTFQFLQENNIPVQQVESITGYPSILGGRVKTLHPKVFGGILNRRELESDINDIAKYEIPAIDLVIVDLYPFEEYVSANASHADIIEKIDIGGISLIRAAAKNYKDVVIVPSKDSYPVLKNILETNGCQTTIEEREFLEKQAFMGTSHYDTAIFNYFNSKQNIPDFEKNIYNHKGIRYGKKTKGYKGGDG